MKISRQESYPRISGTLLSQEWWSRKHQVGALLILLLPMLLYYSYDTLLGEQKHHDRNDDDRYSRTPFCSANDGTCGESPSIASPRTIYSSKSARGQKQWEDYNDQLNLVAKTYAENRKDIGSYTKASRPLVFLGDSITESWVGTKYGTKSSRAQGPKALQELVEESENALHSNNNRLPFDPLVLGISGDQTQHLLWRLQNGQLQPEYANDPDALFVVLIGTNNLGAGELPGPTADGIITVIQYLLDHIQGSIIYMNLLPRADTQRLAPLCPPRCQTDDQPYQSFLPAIDKVNDFVHQQMDELQLYQRVIPVKCGDAFLMVQQKDNASMKSVNETLMPDRLHPNLEGHRILANCIKRPIGY